MLKPKPPTRPSAPRAAPRASPGAARPRSRSPGPERPLTLAQRAAPERPLTLAQRVAAALAEARSGSGVARLFHRLFALISLIAWLSLAAQIDLLVGSRGLLPAAPFLALAQAQGSSFSDLPTFLRWTGGGDTALHAGITVGALLCVAALLGLRPRLSLALSTFLYLGYAVACRQFLGFQWDNLLLECGLLAVLLPVDRRADLVHLLFRVLLFKLYWESGLAKWQSPLHDWQDGSAMTFYYETAPLPARLAHAFHALPEFWHHLESWFTLFFELALPPFIFAPRRWRLSAGLIFTVFQLVNIVTANYGFFSYLALALHAFLLSERDLLRARRALEQRFPWLHRLRVRARALRIARLRRSPFQQLGKVLWSFVPAPKQRRIREWAVRGVAFAYLAISLLEGTAYFGDAPGLLEPIADLRAVYAPLRLVNNYHLFAAITRERIEPELQTQEGESEPWVAHDLAYKPGDPRRAPQLVAPHQPRVDFLLWFYGLSYRRATPAYVNALLERVCSEPSAVKQLFPGGLPEHPRAARMGFWRYHFTSRDELSATGAWWRREWMGATPELVCR